MTKAEQFEALAQRCEQATGPDRELDAAIWLLCVPGATRMQWSYVHIATERTCEIDETRDATGRLIIVPAYSASLDAARQIDTSALIVFASDIGADGLPMVKVANNTSTSPVVEHTGIARTLELAWCAASLRARAAAERGM
jgi:hypothetical protein